MRVNSSAETRILLGSKSAPAPCVRGMIASAALLGVAPVITSNGRTDRLSDIVVFHARLNAGKNICDSAYSASESPRRHRARKSQNRSIVEFPWGMYPPVVRCENPWCWANAVITVPMNSRAWSDRISSGTPWRNRMWSSIAASTFVC